MASVKKSAGPKKQDSVPEEWDDWDEKPKPKKTSKSLQSSKGDTWEEDWTAPEKSSPRKSEKKVKETSSLNGWLDQPNNEK